MNAHAPMISGQSHGAKRLWQRPRTLSRRVLLVEPYSGGRRVLAELLRQDGCIVTEAEDKNGALAFARFRAFDAVVTDIVFPDRQPHEHFIHELRSHQPDAAIIVVSGLVGCQRLTALGFDDPLPRVRRGGADRCFAKPIDVHRLLAAIRMESRPRQALLA